MNSKVRLSALMLLDSSIVIFSIFIGYALLYPGESLSQAILIMSSVVLLVSHHLAAVYYGLYRRVWSYASMPELTAIFKAVSLSMVIVAIAQFFIYDKVLIRAIIITWMMHLLFIGGSRFIWRLVRETRLQKPPLENTKRTLIIGAGSAGTSIVHQIKHSESPTLKPVAFLDNDEQKIGLQIYDVSVVGNMSCLEKIVEKLQIEHIIIAIPSMQKSQLAALTNRCVATGIKTQTTPSLEDLWEGDVSISEIRDVKIEDLLGREEISLDMSSISSKVTNKTVLVTGAGGSIGSELCRQIIRFTPQQLILLGHGENSIYQIYMELNQLETVKNGDVNIVQVIADIRDRKRMFHIMGIYQPDMVYHAAAHKHVPLMEANPTEAIKNNIFGTKNVAEAAHENKVSNFVLVSTDKAVNPTNIMGATKRFAEIIIQNLAKESETNFVAVRFGNVLGSRGSVIPLFKKQIAEGGPVTVTDERMTRYFMTIPEASRLVIQAGSLARGGEVFVLDMGEPVKIMDLAKNLIQLSGYTLEEMPIKVTGLRPGEKLYEELLDSSELQEEQVFDKIFIGNATPLTKEQMNIILTKMQEPNADITEIKSTLIAIANKKETNLALTV